VLVNVAAPLLLLTLLLLLLAKGSTAGAGDIQPFPKLAAVARVVALVLAL
jgi:hypothetical protein